MAIDSDLQDQIRDGRINHSRKITIITRACLSRALTANDWLNMIVAYHKSIPSTHRQSHLELSKPICRTLISLFTSINPPPNRLLSYYRIAVKSTASNDHKTHLISASDAAIAILRWISSASKSDGSTTTNLPGNQSSKSGPAPRTILDLADILSDPLLNKNPRISSTQPLECIIHLNSILDSFNLCRSASASAPEDLASEHGKATLRLTEILLSPLAPSILSIPRSAFLNLKKNLDSLLEKLYRLLLVPSSSPNDSPATLSQLPSILRHLSPSLAQRLAFENRSGKSELSTQDSLKDLQASTRASSIVAHTLLTPGASALRFDEEGKEVPTPLIKRIIGLVIYHPKRFLTSPGVELLPTEQQKSWIFDLFLAAIRMGNTHSSFILDLQASKEMQLDEDENTEDDKVSWKALLGGGRLAELIRLARSNSPTANQSESLLRLKDLELLRYSLIGKEPGPSSKEQTGDLDISMDSDSQPRGLARRQHLWFALLASMCYNQLLNPEDLARIEEGEPRVKALGMIQGHHSEVDLGLSKLIEFLNQSKDSSVTEIALATKQAIITAANAFDLSTCISLAKELTELNTLCSIFLWLEPKDILSPITSLLDDWGSARSNSASKNIINESDGSSEFEKFGWLLGWVQGVVGRFGLMSNLHVHLGTSKGFTIHYLLNPSCAYPLSSLPASHVSTLSSWIEALYGSSGISDDLLVNTDPRVFFTISASLFKQSFDGLRAGLIDLQTFREGLSYFEQDLLIVGCVVGVVGWLVDELSRAGPVPDNSYPTALLEILQAILLSESITPTAIQLVAAKSLRLLRCFNSYFVATQASQIERGLYAPNGQDSRFGDLNRRVQLDIARVESKLTAFPSTNLFTPTGFLSFNFFNIDSLINYGVGMGWEEALNIALKMAITDEVLDLNDHPFHRNNPKKTGPTKGPKKTDATIALWSILPPVLNSMSTEKFVRIVILAISAGIRSGEEPLPPPVSNRIGARVSTGWDAKKYKRVSRAIELAIDVFTWPFEQVGCDYFNRVKRPTIITNLEQGQSLIRSRSKLVGGVLEEVLVEWGKRIGVQEVLEDAELERDIVIGCLDRLSEVESSTLMMKDQDNHEESAKEKDNDDGEKNVEKAKDRAEGDEGSKKLLSISKFYRGLCLEVLKEEIKRMERRDVGRLTKDRGLKILNWIKDSLEVSDDQELVGVIS